jgi:hypothetical protein
MPIGFRTDRHFVEERIAQEMMHIQHESWLIRWIDKDEPFLA